MTELLAGLDAVDWSRLRDAYGPATAFPAHVRALAGGGPAAREHALYELFGTVWHQGTVYDATPAAVPFLARVACAAEVDDETRAGVALLLASVAAADDAVLPPGGPPRDLVAECAAAVGAVADDLFATAATAPPGTRAALVGVLAAVAPRTGDDVRAWLRDVAATAADVTLAHAARLALALAAEPFPLPAEELAALAAVDEDAADYLLDVAGPPRANALGVATILVERAVTNALTTSGE